jgi:hypothetical protein
MRIFRIILSAILTAGSVFVMVVEGLTWSALGGLLLFGSGTLIFLFEGKWNTWTDKRIKQRIKSRQCVLKTDHIHFPRGYYFRHGHLKKRNTLHYAVIDEIRINTVPISAKINNNEIIFLDGPDKNECVEFARNNNIPVTEPQDNWSLICDEFLDTEFGEDVKERTIRQLEENGIERGELAKIRKRISFRMLMRTYASWEWIYYGQYDVLSELWPLTKKKYWWTMDIALRKKTAGIQADSMSRPFAG